MDKHHVLWLTDRGERHQRSALEAAPPMLDVTIKRRPTPEVLMPLLSTAEFIITERNEPVTSSMIAAAPNLKLILRLGSLSHDIDTNAAQKAHVRVSIQPVIMTIYCAEHAVMMILAVTKHLGRSLHAATTADHGLPARRTDENTFAFNWLNYTDIGGLIGKKFGILGMGEIGVELARRLKPFRLDTLYYNKRSPYPATVEQELGITYADLHTCLRESDIIVTLLPFFDDTDRSIHAGTFGMMKQDAALVHLGSGSVIDEQALVAALQSGKLSGAALDTFEYEPLQPTHSLVALARQPNSNLLLTPHTAAASIFGSRADDYAEIVRYLNDQPLKYEI